MAWSRRRPVIHWWLSACCLVACCTRYAIAKTPDCREAVIDPTTGSDFLSVTCEDGGARVVRDLLASDTYGNLYVQVVYNNSIEGIKTLSSLPSFAPVNESVNITKGSLVTIWACIIISNNPPYLINGSNHTCPEQRGRALMDEPIVTTSQTVVVSPTSLPHLSEYSATSSILTSRYTASSMASVPTTSMDPASDVPLTGATDNVNIVIGMSIGSIVAFMLVFLITVIICRGTRCNREQGDGFRFSFSEDEIDIRMPHWDSQGSLVTQIEPVDLFSLNDKSGFRPWHSSTSTRKNDTSADLLQKSISLYTLSRVHNRDFLDFQTADYVTQLSASHQELSGSSPCVHQAVTAQTHSINTPSGYIPFPGTNPTVSTSVGSLDFFSYLSGSEGSLASDQPTHW